jgi:hypothetical protein
MFPDFLQRLAIFEGNVARNNILNGLGHFESTPLIQNARRN